MCWPCLIQCWAHFKEVTVCPSVKCCFNSTFITLLLSESCICVGPFYRWENGGWRAGHTWQPFCCRNCERWGFNIQQGIPVKGSSCLLSSQKEAAQKCVPVCDWLGPWMMVFTGAGRQSGGNQNKEWVLLYFPALGINRILTFVTAECGSIRKICVCWRSLWKHPEHRWLWRVYPVSRPVVAEHINMREILKLIYFSHKNVTDALYRIESMIRISYASCGSGNGPYLKVSFLFYLSIQCCCANLEIFRKAKGIPKQTRILQIVQREGLKASSYTMKHDQTSRY